jgi:hypothetical protein
MGKLAPQGASQSEGAVGTSQAARARSQALAASKVHPLLQVEWLLLSVGEVLLKAMLRAKLPMRKSVANQTEAATTGRAAHLDLRDIGFRTTFAHQRSSSFGHPAVREGYLWDLNGATNWLLERPKCFQ